MMALLAPCLLVAACSAARPARRPRPRAPGAHRPSGPPRRPDLKPSPPRDGGPGLQLLRQAAQAGCHVSYQGVEMVSAWGVAGDTTVIANIWHHSGGDTLVQAAAAGTVSQGQRTSVSDDTDSQAPEGVLGVTWQLVSLLGANYDLAYLGPGSTDSRPAQVVEAWRENGSLAARFWLDQATKLPLRREVFDSGAHLISEDVFIDLKVGAFAADAGPAGPGGSAGRRVCRDGRDARNAAHRRGRNATARPRLAGSRRPAGRPGHVRGG